MSKIEMTKKYRYRNGELARVLCVDGANSDDPVISLSVEGWPKAHNENGQFCRDGSEHHYDLIEVKQPEYRWLNVYRSYTVMVRCHESKELADKEAASDRIACIKIDLNEIKGRFDE